MDVRFNIFDKKGKWIGVDYLTDKFKWMHKWVEKGVLERGSWRGRAVGENDLDWTYKIAETSSVLQANELLLYVSNSACPKCGSTDCDEDNNVKRCIDCYTIY